MKIIREATPSEFIKKAIILVIGTAIMALGCSCYYLSNAGVNNVGADPTGVFMIGVHIQLSRLVTIEYGTTMILINASLFVFLLIFKRKFLYFGTLVNALLLGTFINVFNDLLRWMFPSGFPLPLHYMLPVIGTLLMGISLAIYLPINWGASVIDCIILWIYEAAKKLPYKAVFWLLYLFFIITGLLMGGSVGYGTIVAAVFTGIVFDVLRCPLQKVVRVIFRLPPLESEAPEAKTA